MARRGAALAAAAALEGAQHGAELRGVGAAGAGAGEVPVGAEERLAPGGEDFF